MLADVCGPCDSKDLRDFAQRVSSTCIVEWVRVFFCCSRCFLLSLQGLFFAVVAEARFFSFAVVAVPGAFCIAVVAGVRVDIFLFAVDLCLFGLFSWWRWGVRCISMANLYFRSAIDRKTSIFFILELQKPLFSVHWIRKTCIFLDIS